MSFRIKFIAVVAVAALLLCADMSWAQPGGGRGGRGGGGFFGRGGNNMTGLLAQEDVQKEIGLVEDQIEEYKERVQEYQDEIREMFSGMRDAEDRRAFFEEMREKMTAKTEELNDWLENDLLLPDQTKRLKQLVVQAGNRRGLHNNEGLIEQLGISDSQIEKMQKKAEEQEKIIADKLAKLRSDAQEEIFAILDKDQRKKLKELMGDNYTFQQRTQQRGQRGGDQGGRGGRGGEGGRPDF